MTRSSCCELMVTKQRQRGDWRASHINVGFFLFFPTVQNALPNIVVRHSRLLRSQIVLLLCQMVMQCLSFCALEFWNYLNNCGKDLMSSQFSMRSVQILGNKIICEHFRSYILFQMVLSNCCCSAFFFFFIGDIQAVGQCARACRGVRCTVLSR